MVPPDPARLRFTPASNECFTRLFADAAAGSLDVMTARELEQTTAADLARDEVAHYLSRWRRRSTGPVTSWSRCASTWSRPRCTDRRRRHPPAGEDYSSQTPLIIRFGEEFAACPVKCSMPLDRRSAGQEPRARGGLTRAGPRRVRARRPGSGAGERLEACPEP